MVYFPPTGKPATADATTAARGLDRLPQGGYPRRRGGGPAEPEAPWSLWGSLSI